MSQQIINISTPDDGLGDVLRNGFDKTNQNFTELYNGKVDKVTGKGLSENDFTDADKAKLDGIEAGAEVNVQADWGETDPTADSFILNKPPSLYSAFGYFHYADLDTQTTPLALVASTPLQLINDTLGAFTNEDQAPYGISGVWDKPADSLDFSQLSIGDAVLFRADLSISTTSVNQNLQLYIKFGIGTPSEYDLLIDSWNEKSVVTFKHFLKDISFSIDNEDWRTAPAKIYILSDHNGSVKVNGWYIPIIRKSVNLIDFYSDPSKQDKLTETNFGQFMDVDLATKLTPSVNDTFVGRDILTNEAVEFPMDYIQPKLTNPITGIGANGQVAFFNGATTQTGDNGLFWDNTNKRLGIGTNTPSTSLDVLGALTLRKTSENEQTILTINRFNSIPMFKLHISGVDENQLFLRNDNNQNIITFARTGGVIVQGSLYSNTELGIGRSIGGYLSKFLSTNADGSFYELQTDIEGVGWGSLLQWNRNKTYFNILSNNVGIGTTSPQSRLDVRAQGALPTDIAFRVRNSTDTGNLLQVNGQGTLSLGLQSSAPTGIEGAIYYNSTDKKHYGFDGTNWNALY